MTMRTIHVWPLIVAHLVLAGCGDRAAKQEATPGAAAPDAAKKESAEAMPASSIELSAAQIAHGKIAWAPVTMGAVASAASVPGQVTTDEDRTARLGAPARGRVTSVNVSPGDRVTRGQTLAVLASAEAGSAQSDVAKAQAAVSSRRAQAQYAQAAKARAERLLALKAIPRQDYDRAIADDELAQSDLRAAEAELRRAGTLASQLGAEANASGSIVLRAPQDGVVLSRTGVPGSVVEAGTPLVVITDPSRLWLVVNAPEQFAGLFNAGAALRFVVPAYADTFSARITAVGAGLDPDTRTLQVRAAADARNGRLKPGMLATVFVAGARQTSGAMLPDDAVQVMQGKPVVFVVAPDGKGGARFTRRDVEVGSRTAGRIGVLRGINAGEVVVTTGAFAVKAEFQKASMPKMEM
jgi:cobalt-zinc-cadmium efflux system membrane fusion protein